MRTRIPQCFLLFLLVLISSIFSFSQNQPPQSDAQALSLISQSMAVLTGGNTISDATLNGSATWIVASSSETATATLSAKGTGESRFDMALSEGQRSEIRNDGSSTSQGELLASDGSTLPWPHEDCLTNASWFFPQLSVLAGTGDPTLIFHYVGVETRNGVSVQHIQSYRYSSTDTVNIQQLSTMDIYLDAASLLPTAFMFTIHSEDGISPDLEVEVDFSNYQSVNGAQIPFRIQRYVGGTLGLDFGVASAQLNSGLSDSLFAIQ